MSGLILEPSISGGTADWIPIPRCAEELSVSSKTVRRMITRGEIEARRFGPRLIRVNLASLERAGQPLQYTEAS
ncbi:MAG: Helix-turn-helix protein [Microbacteriaceae bacterium]|nr:Helix-turn-helix protein [Microbacteriaceae bacterium]